LAFGLSFVSSPGVVEGLPLTAGRRKKTNKHPTSSPTPTNKQHRQTQGTLYDLNGVLSGDLAITGGTGAFKGLRGNEQLSYNTATNTGTAKFFVS
jgi:hypothetical protein